MKKSFLFLGILAFYGCQQAPTITLNEGENPLYEIVLNDDPDEFEQLAVKQLQDYLSKITHVRFPLGNKNSEKRKIIVGKLDDLAEHTVHYGIQDGHLLIQGGSGKSTLYAVFEFLERELGCRFYSPTAEKVPTQTNIQLDRNLDYTYTPPIHTRTVHSRLFYENPFFAHQQKVTTEAFPTYVPVSKVHTFHRFLPAEKFYDSYPEYYALRNGKRLPTQLCLTNETVLKIVKDSVAQQLARYPEAKVISVSQDDNTQYCQCDQCEAIHQKEASPAGSMIDFVNKIARAFPNKQISTLAYQYTRKAPKNIRPEPNVLITLCSIECDRSAPIEEKCQDFKDDLISWGKVSDNIRIWDYTTQFTNFLAPFPNWKTLQPNVRLFNNNNAKWIFEQHSNQPSELFELRSYLTAKLLWNPDVDEAAVIKDFTEGYYQEAAPFIRAYITTIQEELEKDSSFFLFLYGDPSQAFESFLNEKNLTVYDSLFDKAADAIQNKPDLVKRVNAARLSIDYTILENTKRNMASEAKGKKGQLLKNRLNRFKTTTNHNNITAMNEMRYSVEEYLSLYQRTLQRAGQTNLALQKPVELLTTPKKYAKEDPQTLTDGAFGSSSFYANWLGFEGNHLEAIVDLGTLQTVKAISSGFLQVTNHIVFFPKKVTYEISEDGEFYRHFGTVVNQSPLTKKSKINDIQYFTAEKIPTSVRYVKITAENHLEAPVWHHAAGLPSWIFVDELEVR
ncbi:MAG: DUF4838 domain-containing protein [Bacteroidota bacterium]